MMVGGGASVTWLGHSAFSIASCDGRVILIDPFLSQNPMCPLHLASPTRCDNMLLTHGHADHVGDAVPIALRTQCQVIGMPELVGWVASKGVTNVIGMNKGGTVDVGGIAVTMVHALHSSSITDGDRSIYAGEAAGYVVRLENGFSIYHAGDTCVFGDMALIGELYKPDLALLPIGDHYTMSSREAARAVDLIGAKHVVPMHTGTFAVLSGTPEDLQRLLASRPDVELHILAPGETLD